MSRPSERLDGLLEELDSDNAIAAPAEISDRVQVTSAIDAAAERFGGLDAVVAGAGVVIPATIGEQTEEECRSVINTNFFGTLWTLQAAMPHLNAAGGHFLALASIAGIMPAPLSGVYPATKAAVGQLVSQVRIETRNLPMSAGVAYLGMVDTEMSTSISDDERLGRALDSTPSFLTGSLDPEATARRLVRGLQRREATIITPWWLTPSAAPELALKRATETAIRFSALARELPTRRPRTPHPNE